MRSRRLLNEAVVREVWSQPMLPERCRQAWESRFPVLAV